MRPYLASLFIGLGAILLLIPIMATANAKTKAKKERFQFAWIIQNSSAETGKKWVAPYTEVASATLAPPNLWRSEADVLAENGQPLVPAGTEFSQLVSERVIICTIDAPSDKQIKKKYKFGDNRHVCLLDEDRDGTFDQYFRRLLPSDFLMTEGKIPLKMKPTQPTSLLRADPLQASLVPKVHLKYGWYASLVDELIFQTCLGEVTRKSSKGCFGRFITVKTKDLPQEFSALGGRFRVFAKEEDRIEVEMIKSFEPVPLMIRAGW